MDAQYYVADSAIGADNVPEKMGVNAFGNVLYTLNNFTAGVRFECFMPPLQGFDSRMKGIGFSYRFMNYKIHNLDVTLGNFYEQFGNGLVLRTYEDWTLGYDNSIDGLRLKYTLGKGIYLKGLIGKQRKYWEKSNGNLRAADIEVSFNDLISKFSESKTRLTIGGSFVSKFQEDDPTFTYKLPENVAAFAGRLNISRSGFNLNGEYAYKINDPSEYNNNIYRPGQALFLATSYSRKGLSIMVSAKRIDNMAFKTDRKERGAVMDINFLPPLTRQHSYNLSAMYPYATQPNGEFGFQGQLIYKIKKGSKIGGKYGTEISINYSRVHNIDKTALNDSPVIGTEGTLGYNSNFFKIGKELYFSDLSVDVSRKFNKHFKAILSYVFIKYNILVIRLEQTSKGENMVNAHIGIADFSYKFNDIHSLRMEIQHLYSKNDYGSWAMVLLEYSIAPKWFISVSDQYNYGNDDSNNRQHYYNISAGYIHKTNRISLSYGRQRSGIVCTGGVCRQVPASNGLILSITSSF